MTQLLLVTENETIADLLAMILEREKYRVITAFSVSEAIALAGFHKPRIALIDMRCDPVSGLSLIFSLESSIYTECCMVMNSHSTSDIKFKSLNCFSFRESLRNLEDFNKVSQVLLDAIAEQVSYLTPLAEILRIQKGRCGYLTVRGRKIRLTAREHEIVKELASTGARNAELAEKLSLSTRTVESHLSNIYNKTMLKGKGELILAYQSSNPERTTIASASSSVSHRSTTGKIS